MNGPVTAAGGAADQAEASRLPLQEALSGASSHYLSLCRLPLQEALSGASSHDLSLVPLAGASLSKFAHQETVEAEQMMGGGAPSVRVRVAGGGGGVDYESECASPLKIAA